MFRKFGIDVWPAGTKDYRRTKDPNGHINYHIGEIKRLLRFIRLGAGSKKSIAAMIRSAKHHARLAWKCVLILEKK